MMPPAKFSSQYLHRSTSSIQDDPWLDAVVLEHMDTLEQVINRSTAWFTQSHLQTSHRAHVSFTYDLNDTKEGGTREATKE